jgi:hypothetical protein
MPEYFWYVCKVSFGEDSQFHRIDGPGSTSGTKQEVLSFIREKIVSARSRLRRLPRVKVLAICTRNRDAAVQFVSTNLIGWGLTDWEKLHLRADQKFALALEEYRGSTRDVTEESSSDEEEPADPPTEASEVVDWSERP